MIVQLTSIDSGEVVGVRTNLAVPLTLEMESMMGIQLELGVEF